MRLVPHIASCAAVLALVGATTASPRVGAAGVTVALPSGWHQLRMTAPAPGVKTGDPVTRIVVASSPIDFSSRGCNELDYTFSPKGVAIVVVEWVKPTPGVFPRRPRSFTGRNLTVRPPPALECWTGPGGAAQFLEHGRRLMAFVLLGPRAPARLAIRARRVLDTLVAK